jgi:alpha-L-fucosidase
MLEYWDGREWKEIQTFSTIGYKRLLRFKPINTSKLRFTVLAAKGATQLAETGFYKASARE